MRETETMRELLNPRHPANRRLWVRAAACVFLGVACAITAFVETRAFLPLWLMSCAFIWVGGSLSLRYRLRVRSLTPFEMLRAVLIVFVIALTLGLGLPPVLVWLIETYVPAR